MPAIGASPTAAAVLVPRAMAQLLTDHPGITMDFEETGSPVPMRRLAAQRLHAAVISVGHGHPLSRWWPPISVSHSSPASRPRPSRGVPTLTAADRAWPGRATVVVTRRDRPAALTALVAALRDQAAHLGHPDAIEPFGAAGMTTFTSRR